MGIYGTSSTLNIDRQYFILSSEQPYMQEILRPRYRLRCSDSEKLGTMAKLTQPVSDRAGLRSGLSDSKGHALLKKIPKYMNSKTLKCYSP